jgi:hypothetical protein
MGAEQAKQVYLSQGDFDAPPPPFRTAQAGLVWLEENGLFETDTRVRLSANTTHALEGHGVLRALAELPLQGMLGGGQDVIVPQGTLRDAAQVLYEADRNTYGRIWDFLIYTEPGAVPIEYRVRVDNREYQRSLLRLTDLLNMASRVGHAVRLRF